MWLCQLVDHRSRLVFHIWKRSNTDMARSLEQLHFSTAYIRMPVEIHSPLLGLLSSSQIGENGGLQPEYITGQRHDPALQPFSSVVSGLVHELHPA